MKLISNNVYWNNWDNKQSTKIKNLTLLKNFDTFVTTIANKNCYVETYKNNAAFDLLFTLN
jgi:hypothetical protein